MLMKASSSSMLKTRSICMYAHTHNENKRFVRTIYIQVLGFFAALLCFLFTKMHTDTLARP